MKRFLSILVILAAASVPAFAQESQPETVRKLVKLQHVSTDSVADLLREWIATFPSRHLGTLILQGTPDEVAKAEEVIREVDRPGSQSSFEGSVELDAYFLAGGAEPMGGAIPPLVMPVLLELRQRFSYAHYGLLDSTLVVANVRKGANVDGQFSREDGDPVSYRLRFNVDDVKDSERGQLVDLGNLDAQWTIPYKEKVTSFEGGQANVQVAARERHLRIQTNVSIPEGKLVVVGKAGSPTSAQAIFLVLRGATAGVSAP